MFNKNDLIATLSSSVAEVKFVKVNGEKRTMRCTLKESLLPPHQDSNDSDTVLTVYDLDKNDWRSFRIDSVESVLAQ